MKTQIKGCLIETLTPLQCRFLALLKVPETIYDVGFNRTRLIFISST
ncbi:hypothetical protein ACFLYD_06090 [Chloroflexota bacterium]